MAATVEGAFTIVDRVSAKLKRIEERADRTDRAIERLGRRLDGIATKAQADRLDATADAIDRVGKRARTASGHTDRMSGSMSKAQRQVTGLKSKLGELAAAARGLQVVMAPAKFLAIGVGIGVLTQAVNALAAGIVALLPRIGDLSAGLAAIPATVAGIGLAVGATTIAFQGLGKAMGGNKEALKALTPEARQFLDTLKGMQPLMKGLRQSAQQGLFPGLEAALGNVRKGVPMMERLLNRAGRSVGRFATNFTAAFTTRGRLRDLEVLGNQGTRIFDRMGKGLTYIAEAILDVAVAAEPFTDWLSKTVLGWTRYAAASAKAGRESGALGAWFARARVSMEGLGRIASNLAHVLGDIYTASRPLGESLWGAFEGATKRWRTFTESVEGQTALAKYFSDAREPILEMGRFVAELGKQIATFDMSGLAETLRTLRGLLPGLQNGLEGLSGFGPELAAGLAAIGRTMGNLASAASPLGMVLEAFTNLLNVVNDIIERIPAFGALLSAGVVMIGLAKLQAVVLRIAASWGLVATNATRAAAAQRAAGATGAVGGAAGGGLTGLLGRAGRAGGAPGTLGGGMGLIGTARAERGLMRQSGINPNSGAALRSTAGGLAGGAALAGRGLLAGLSKVILPLTALGGILGAFQGTGGRGVGGLAQNVLSGASFGLLKSTSTQDRESEEKLQKRIQDQATQVGRGVAGVKGRGALDTTEKQIGYLRNIRQGAYAGKDKDATETRNLINREIQARKDLLPSLRAERAARRTRGGENYADRSGRALAYETRKRGAQVGVKNFVNDSLAQLGGRDADDPRARIIANSALKQVRAAAKGNPALMKEYERLRKGVGEKFTRMGAQAQVVNGRVLANTKRDWTRTGRAITDPLERARQRSRTSLTSIQRDARQLLVLQGLTPRRAGQEIRDAESNRRAPRTANEVKGSDMARVPNILRPPALQKPGAIKQTIFGGRSPLEALAKPITAASIAKATASTSKITKAAQDSQKAIERSAWGARTTVTKASAQQSVAAVRANQEAQRSAETRWPAINKAISSNARGAQREASSAFSTLTGDAFKQLKTMGYDQAAARKLLAPPKAATDKKKGATGMRVGAAGMRIGGSGLQDNVQVAPGHLAAPGELIVNRHTENRVRRKYGVDLGAEVAGETRKHSATEVEFAKGGRVGGGGVNLMGANPGLAGYATMAAKSGLVVSSGKRAAGGRTASGGISQHGTGDAIDLAGSAAAMLSFARAFSAQYGPQVDQLIHTPLGYGWNRGKKVPGFGAVVDAGHFDHVHIGDSTPTGGKLTGAGAAGAMGGGAAVELMKALKAPTSKFAGVPGALSDAAGKGIAAGITQSVNKKLEKAGAGAAGGGPTGKAGPAPAGQIREWLTEALKATDHFSEANLNALYGRVMQESGGNPRAVNNWDSNAKAGTPSKGLIQTIDPTFNAYKLPGHDNIFNPVDNAIAAIRYMFGRYGHIVGANGRGYEMGGRIPDGSDTASFAGWFGDGGSVTASKPTLIGIGDKRKETAVIRGAGAPKGGGASGMVAGRGVVIEKMTIHNSAPGDIKAAVKDEVREAFEELETELMGQGNEDDRKVLG